MKRIVTACGLVLGVSACGAVNVGAPFEDLPPERIELPVAPHMGVSEAVARAQSSLAAAPFDTGLQVLTYEISVPGHLSAYDRGRADIVWQGDPNGKRKAQVARLLQEAVERARDQSAGHRGVVVQVELDQFRTRTGQLRANSGGVHRIRYYLTVREADGGAFLVARKLVVADLRVANEPDGPTEKERILRHLTQSLMTELSEAALAPDRSPAAISRFATMLSDRFGETLTASQSTPSTAAATPAGPPIADVIAQFEGAGSVASDTAAPAEVSRPLSGLY